MHQPNTKLDYKGLGSESVDGIHQAQLGAIGGLFRTRLPSSSMRGLRYCLLFCQAGLCFLELVCTFSLLSNKLYILSCW
jgi:hypothetical protein